LADNLQVFFQEMAQLPPILAALIEPMRSAIKERLASIGSDQKRNEMFAGVFSKVLSGGWFQNAGIVDPRVKALMLMNDDERRVPLWEFTEPA
jgi:hypothetical protein